jgi:predicted phage-related endonuclease
MIVKEFNNHDDWIASRLGKITGSRLKDIVVKRGTGEKIGFYEIIAERIAQQSDGENPMLRGTRLEDEALEMFSNKIGEDIDNSLVIWEHETIKNIAVSPDGSIGNKKAVEVKCLSSAKHIEAIITKKIPEEYEFQKLQYFIVNEELETLYFVLYDPRMPEHLQLYYFVVNREDIAEDIETYFNYQKDKLTQIEKIITELTF